MSAVVLMKAEDGKLHGFGEKGERAWGKFRKRIDGMEPGETLQFEWHEPRSPAHHRMFFGKLAVILDRQEQFEDVDKLRAWLAVGAGYCDFAPGPKGRMVAIPQSIAWHKLDEADFADLHAKIDAFLWTEHARRFLWPQHADEQTYAMVESILAEFNE